MGGTAQKEAEKNGNPQQTVETVMDMGDPNHLQEDNDAADNLEESNDDMDLEELAFWLPPDYQNNEGVPSECKYKHAA